MTAPMTLNFHGLAGLDGHHQDMQWCQQQGDNACLKAIEFQVKTYAEVPNLAPDLRAANNCYIANSCDPSPALATAIKTNMFGVQSLNAQQLMDKYIKAGTGMTGGDFTDDKETAEQIDAFKDATCKAAAALGQQLPGCPALTGGTTTQTNNVGPVAPKEEPNWLLYAGIGLGALVLLGGVAFLARKRSSVHGLRGCGYAGCHGFSGLGRYQPWNARAAARYNARQYPCR